MAGSIFLPIKAVFDDKGLKEASKQFSGLGKGLKSALGAAGIAVGIAALTSALKDSAKAAAEDAKSQALLANGLRNSVGASQSQIASVEESIRQMQLQAAVADDQIRPAFDQLARATGDLGEATRLTSIALDISAATGKDLGSVSIALSKAVQGSTGALSRLGINVKGVSDPIGMLEQRFQGAAEAAANNDPFQRLAIIFDDMREQVGQYLLPLLNDLASYFASADFASAFDKFAFSVGKAIQQIDTLFTQLTGENALTWLLNTVSDIIYQVMRLIKSFTILGDILGKQGQAWLKLDFNTLINFDWQKYAADQMAEFDRAWKQESTNSKAKPFDPLTTGDYTGGGGGGGGKAVEDQRTKNLKKALEERRKAIAEANKKIQESIKGNAEAFEQMRQAGEDALNAVRESLAGLASELLTAVAKSADLGEFEANIVSTFINIKQTIQDAFSNGQIFGDAAKALQAYADKEQAAFVRIARQRDVLAKKIEIARALSSSIVSAGNITNLLEQQSQTVTETVRRMVNGVELVTTKTSEQVTNGDLVGNFQKLVDKTKAFAKNLIELRKLGLNGNLFKQIVEAGVDAGGATAEAIIAGGGSTITELNSLYKQLADAGASVAQTATDEFFTLGESVTNSFIDGLLAQESQLAQAAEVLANSFNKVFGERMLSAVAGKNMADQRALIESQLSSVDAALLQARSQLAALGKVSAVSSPQRYGVASGLNAEIRALMSQRAGLEAQLAPFTAATGAGSMSNTNTTINVSVNAGAVADKASLPGIIVDALGTYVRQSGSAALTRILAV